MKFFYTAAFKKVFFFVAFTAIVLVSSFIKTSAQTAVSQLDNTPALILEFSGTINQNTSVLSWTMENETNCKYFVIERSANGDSYDSIDVVMGLNYGHQTDYSYTDMDAMNGSNFYRLRQVNRDGGVKYSKVISVNNTIAPTGKMQVYPNPAGAVVNYTVNSSGSDMVTVEVFNLAGVIVMSHPQQLSAGLNQQSIAISTLKSGNYFLKIVSREGGNQYVQSFVKLM